MSVRCLRCMKIIRSGQARCDNCGFDNAAYVVPQGALAPNVLLQGRFLVGMAKRPDPVTFAYSGIDKQTGGRITVREFYAPDVMIRLGNGKDVAFFNEREAQFREKREAFAREAGRKSAADPAFVLFKENHTYYLVHCLDPDPKEGIYAQINRNANATGTIGLDRTEEDVVRENQPDRTNPGSSDSVGEPPGKTGSRRWLLILGIVLGVLVLGTAGYFIGRKLLFNEKRQEETEKSTDEAQTQEAQTETDWEDETGDMGAPATEQADVPQAETQQTEAPQTETQQTEAPQTETQQAQLPQTEIAQTEAPQAQVQETQVPQTEAPGAGRSTKNYDPGTTMMIYIIGTNLESQHAEASRDLRELMDAQIDTNINHVLVYTGGANSWDLDISTSYNTVYELDGSGLREVANTGTTVNMGEPDTLADFINMCTDKYPSEHYALVLWDHGGGPMLGFGVDELYGDDGLTIPEMRSAMDQTIFAQQHLDLVAYNACIMNSLETAQMWSSYADYMLADAEVEYSWDFRCFDILNTTSDPVRISERIAQKYTALFGGDNGLPKHTRCAIQCMDLSYMPQISQALENLSAKMLQGMDAGDYAGICRARIDCIQYGYVPVGKREYAYDLADVGSLCKGLSKLWPDETAALTGAIETSIQCGVNTLPDSIGVGIYFPYDREDFYTTSDPICNPDNFVPFDQYREFVKKFRSRHFDGAASGISWDLAAGSDGAGVASMQLDAGQLSETAGVYATVVETDPDGSCVALLKEYPVEVAADGSVVLERVPDRICLVSSADTHSAEVPITFLEQAGGISFFATDSIYPKGAAADLLGVEEVSVHALFVDDRTNDELEVLEFAADVDPEDGIRNTRNEVSIKGWNSISYSLKRFYPTRDGAGRLEPYDLWTEAEEGKERTLKIDYLDPPTAGREYLDPDNAYAVQFVVEDVYGDRHGSELIPVE